jgi:hypothetical protein
MDDINNDHGDAEVAAFLVARYMLLISYLALFLVPYADLQDLFIPLHVVLLASVNIMLILVIKLTQKLLNNLTYSSPQ